MGTSAGADPLASHRRELGFTPGCLGDRIHLPRHPARHAPQPRGPVRAGTGLLARQPCGRRADASPDPLAGASYVGRRANPAPGLPRGRRRRPGAAHDPEHWFPQRSLLSPDTFEVSWRAGSSSWRAAPPSSGPSPTRVPTALGHLTVFERNGTLTGDVAELGYQLVPSARGRGAAKGASRLAISYAFRPKEDGGLGLGDWSQRRPRTTSRATPGCVPSGSPSSAGSVRRIHCPTAPTVTPSTGSCSARRPHPPRTSPARLRATIAPSTCHPPQTPQARVARGPPRALLPQWALPAERLGQLDLFRPLGEPELWVVLATGDRPAASRRNRARWVLVSDGPGVEVMGPILKSEANLKSRGAIGAAPHSYVEAEVPDSTRTARPGRQIPRDVPEHACTTSRLRSRTLVFNIFSRRGGLA